MDSTLLDALIAIGEHLRRHRRPWCVVGGIAASFWGEPRFTKDLDVVVLASGDDDATDVLRALLRAGWQLDVLLEHAHSGQLATARLFDARGQRIDVLFSTCGIEAEILHAATLEAVLPDMVVPMVRPGHLVAMKLLSIRDARAQDAIDLSHLIPVLDEGEQARAREACRLIMERGAGRGRDLTADLETWLARARG